MDSDVETNHSGKKIVKKSVFNVLVILVIAVSLIAVFFAGSYISLMQSQVLNQRFQKIRYRRNQTYSQPKYHLMTIRS
jgi:uncharacterized membrane protein